MELKILYIDSHYVAIDKPAGLLVHRSGIAADAEQFALQLLRNQLGEQVWPCHRLDRKTSGILLFALSREALIAMRNEWEGGRVQKKYRALVRGFLPEEMVVDYALVNDRGQLQNALTRIVNLRQWECDFPSGKFETSRYSLVELEPLTGRQHQLRKHMAHIFHPILGDRPHGCNKQNRLMLERFALKEMLLSATELCFNQPFSSARIVIKNPVSAETNRMMDIFDQLALI